MNTSPCGPHLKEYAAHLVGAGSVPFAAKGAAAEDNEALFDAAGWEEEELQQEPGSRTVTEKEVKESTGDERRGWIDAAWKEYNESFLDMGAISVSTASEIKAFGGAHRALPMKLVWVQKPDKKKCRGVVCGNFEEKDPTEQVWTAQAETS